MYFITIILVVIYYFNGIKYGDLNINIANVYDGGTESIIRLNLLNLKNYVLLNGIVFNCNFYFIQKNYETK